MNFLRVAAGMVSSATATVLSTLATLEASWSDCDCALVIRKNWIHASWLAIRITVISSTERARSDRGRMLIGGSRGPVDHEDIAVTPHRLKIVRMGRVVLDQLAQPRDLDVDGCDPAGRTHGPWRVPSGARG